MIKLKNVFKSFPVASKENLILEDINISVNQGDIYGIVGQTGSGKSTLLRLMNGFIQPDQGQVYLLGEKLQDKTRQRLVKESSLIFQHFNLLNNLTVLDNILLPIKIRGQSLKSFKDQAHELLDFVGLEDKKEAYPATLSGGEKQRVAIARSLITEPKVIFSDEPTSALDQKMSLEILELLRDINENLGTTIVLISHDIGIIRALCNRVAILEDGKITQELSLKPQGLKHLDYLEALKTND